ncbi:tRNA pseudouridine(55) synthase TruB, partial [Klebsiella pneumoniae]|nr:tRNA pseudouridine(55) synthase TruB [Klebsiella pneumoniae]
ALKHEGQRLYALARAGQAVERAPRAVVIHELQLLAATPSTLDLEVQCSKGTYIRTLAEDLAVALGTVGHVRALRRLWAAPFQGAPMYTLE